MQIKNIVITHNDTDHYRFFKDVFPTSSHLPFLININISCTFDRLPHPLRTWITGIGAMEKVRTFNGGHRCGHLKNEKCGKITLCPENPEVMAEVLSANAGGCEDPKEANIDSIVIGITFKEFKMHLSGDFEDCTPKQKMNGPQRTMVNVYGDELKSTVYMLSHHGANRCANKEVMLDAVQPKAVFASSDPYRENFRHPKCSITDYLKRKNYLCKPMDSSSGRHPMEDTILDYKLQQVSSDDAFLTWSERLFHAVGPAMEKEQSPNFVEDRGYLHVRVRLHVSGYKADKCCLTGTFYLCAMARFLAGWLWLMVVIDFTALSTAMNGPDKSLWLKFLNFKKWKHRNDNRYEQVQNQLSEFRFGGQTGPNGNQSPSGPAASGAIGPAGSVGGTRSQSYQGPTGSKLGLTGSSGLLRQSGPSGYSGPAGSSGQLGSPGLQGPLGLAGMKKFPRLLQLDALPVGQGSALVLQCPNKDITIIDLGSAEKKKTIFWSTTEIKDFFRERFHLIKNIVITHNHDDHYSLFSKVFNSSDDLPGLINIYISLTPEDMPGILRNWTIDINATDKIRMFNGGQACGISNETPCDIITLCEEDPDIKTLVLSANAANFPKKDKSKTAKTKNNKLKNDKTKNDITKNDERRKDKMKQVTEQTKEEKPNVNSIVIGITFKTFTMLLDGDFEDCSARQKNGPLDKMADILDKNNYPRFTVYMLAHHGAGRCANKPHLLDVVQPKAVFVSANPWSTYRHPNCTVIEHLTKYLCQPGEIDENSPFYCGQHPMGSIDHVDKLQTEYTCGLNIEKEVTNAPEPMRRRKVTDNTFAIYSTTPLKDTINRVHLVTDGDKWGFINNIKKPKNP